MTAVVCLKQKTTTVNQNLEILRLTKANKKDLSPCFPIHFAKTEGLRAYGDGLLIGISNDIFFCFYFF